MQRGITRKWRPSLALVLGCTIAVILCLPVAGIVAVRYLYPVLGYREAVLAVSICIVMIAAYVGWVLWRILLRPIRALANHADHIRTGQGGDGALQHYGTSEMRALGAAMLDMGETLQSRETVLRTYADHVTHELKSPLTVIRGASELLALDGLDAAERVRLLGRVDDAVVRMAALLDAQRDLARAQDVVAVGRCRLSNLSLPEGVTISGDAEVPLPVGVLEAVLGHLISNAFAHGATDVTVTADEKTIRVADNGIGISQGNRQRIFDPYFTTRRDTGGTGMGLAIVRRLLGTQGARIALLDEPSTVFEITF
jgi:signal transduction histidine kinase